MQGFEITLKNIFENNQIFLPLNNCEIVVTDITDSKNSDYEDIIHVVFSYFFWETNNLERRIPSEVDIVKAINNTTSCKVTKIKEQKYKEYSQEYKDNMVNILFNIEILYTHKQNVKTEAVNSKIACLYALQDFAEIFDKEYRPMFQKACLTRDGRSGDTLERLDDGKINETQAHALWNKGDEDFFEVIATLSNAVLSYAEVVEKCFTDNGINLPTNTDAIFDIFEILANEDESLEYLEEINDNKSLGDRLIDHLDFMMKLFDEDIDNFAKTAEKHYKKLGLIW